MDKTQDWIIQKAEQKIQDLFINNELNITSNFEAITYFVSRGKSSIWTKKQVESYIEMNALYDSTNAPYFEDCHFVLDDFISITSILRVVEILNLYKYVDWCKDYIYSYHREYLSDFQLFYLYRNRFVFDLEFTKRLVIEKIYEIDLENNYPYSASCIGVTIFLANQISLPDYLLPKIKILLGKLAKMQKEDGHWRFLEGQKFYNSDIPKIYKFYNDIVTTNICVHALSYYPDYEKVIKDAGNWLKKQMNDEGVWIRDNQVFFNVLCLDSIRLSEGVKDITFKKGDNIREMNRKNYFILATTDVEWDVLYTKLVHLNGTENRFSEKDNIRYIFKTLKNGANIYATLIPAMGAQNRNGAQNFIHNLILLAENLYLENYSIILGGICFGVNCEISKNSKEHGLDFANVLVSEKIWDYSFSKIHDDGKIEFRGDTYDSDGGLLQLFRMSSPMITVDYKFHFGLTCCGPVLLDNKDFVSNLSKEKPKLLGGDMEGFYVISSAYKGTENIPTIVVKGICDWGFNKAGEHQKKAAENSYDFIFKCIESLNNI